MHCRRRSCSAAPTTWSLGLGSHRIPNPQPSPSPVYPLTLTLSKALQLLCSNVVAHPEEQRFRTIRLLNANFQARRGMHHART